MFNSDNELRLETQRYRQQQLRREADRQRLVRQVRLAARDERQPNARHQTANRITRILSLFF
ncbi:MAG: hypothetical protein SF162_11130 [bacterium]|nr:hypothetical protein [bacterium]